MLTTEAACRSARLFSAITTLIDLSEDMQSEMIQSKMHTGSKHWIEDFCTIHIRGPRRSGHSLSVVSLLQHRYNRVLVLMQNMKMAVNFEQQLENSHLSSKAVVSSVHRTDSLLGQRTFDAIIVDNAYMMNAEEIKKVFDIAVPHSESHRREGSSFVVLFLQ